jgi:hypothetical protein
MLRSSSLLSALSCGLCWTALAAAQTEEVKPPEPPPVEAPSAAEPAPEAPSSPAPVAPSTPPVAEPAPTPSSPAPPSSDAFPAPAPVPEAPARSAPRPVTAPPPTAPVRSQVDDPRREERRPKPSEGLFQSASSPAAVHHVKDDDRDDRGTDQFKIGPVVGTGVPSVISVGGTIKVTRFLGAGVNLGLIPKVKLSYYGDATLSYQHVDVYGRLYPFGGGLFLHGGLGYANVNGTLSGSQSYSQANVTGRVDYNGVGKVHTPTLTALIGYFHTTSIGFSFGVDAGAQIPIAPSTIGFESDPPTITTTPPGLAPAITPQANAYADKVDQSVRDTLEKIGRTTIPTVNLRIGWIL